MAVRVGSASRHERGWSAQQLFVGVHPGAPSMLSMHADASHAACSSQFGPPSVARMKNVFPENDFTRVLRSRIVAAVGVPPFGTEFVAVRSSVVVGPSFDEDGGSPGRIDITSAPVTQALALVRPGNIMAPKFAR